MYAKVNCRLQAKECVTIKTSSKKELEQWTESNRDISGRQPIKVTAIV